MMTIERIFTPMVFFTAHQTRTSHDTSACLIVSQDRLIGKAQTFTCHLDSSWQRTPVSAMCISHTGATPWAGGDA